MVRSGERIRRHKRVFGTNPARSPQSGLTSSLGEFARHNWQSPSLDFCYAGLGGCEGLDARA
jgi:hypothetical protein